MHKMYVCFVALCYIGKCFHPFVKTQIKYQCVLAIDNSCIQGMYIFVNIYNIGSHTIPKSNTNQIGSNTNTLNQIQYWYIVFKNQMCIERG